MAIYDSNTWDDAIERALQWKKERNEAVETIKKRAAAEFEETLRNLVASAVLEKLRFEVVSEFPEDGDPEYFPVTAYAVFRTGRANYLLDVQNGVWEAYPRDAN